MESSSTSERLRACDVELRRAVIFVVLNLFCIVVFALFHRYSTSADLQTQLSYQAYVCWIFVETAILFSPAFAALFVASLVRAPTVLRRLAVLLALAVSACYFLDLAVVISMREHLLSAMFWELLGIVRPYLWVYLLPSHLFRAATVVGAWFATQYTWWYLSGKLSRRGKKCQEKVSAMKLAAAVSAGTIPVILALYPVYRTWPETRQEMQTAVDRHPINLLGFTPANRAPSLRPSDPAAVRGKALLLSKHDEIAGFRKSYRSLEYGYRAQPKEPDVLPRPDILIVISECLRSDVISPATTPYLFRKANQGLWARQHYSSGNASCYGFFGAMFGVEATWFDQAKDLPVGVCAAVKSLGYETGFFGRDDFNSFGMENFCAPERFDYSSFRAPTNSVDCDRLATQDVSDFLSRTGAYEATNRAPRLAFLYLFSPHDGFHESADTARPNGSDFSNTFQGVRNQQGFSDFLSSVHFVDRSIASLEGDNRMTFVLGDHGESFGEDNRSMHGSALSAVQLQTSFIGFGGAVPMIQLDAPTSHCDLLPTILNLLGASVSNEAVFAGHSLIGNLPQKRVLVCRGMTGTNYLFVDSRRRRGQETLGYQGFFDWNLPVLAPGAYSDMIGDAVQGDESVETPMRQWMKHRLGIDFATVPDDPAELLRPVLAHQNAQIRIKAISMARELGANALTIESEIKGCLSDSNAEVRQRAFDLLHELRRLAPAD